MIIENTGDGSHQIYPVFQFLEGFMGISGHTHTQEQLDDYANQHNPNNEAYQADLDNYANQLNPNNDEYWHSRGEEKPEELKS